MAKKNITAIMLLVLVCIVVQLSSVEALRDLPIEKEVHLPIGKEFKELNDVVQEDLKNIEKPLDFKDTYIAKPNVFNKFDHIVVDARSTAKVADGPNH